MNRLAIIGLAFLAVIAWAQFERAGRIAARAEAAEVRADLNIAKATIAQAEEAARVHRAYLDRAEEDARKWDAIENEFQNMEGGDAPLSPYLRAASERLWGKG